MGTRVRIAFSLILLLGGMPGVGDLLDEGLTLDLGLTIQGADADDPDVPDSHARNVVPETIVALVFPEMPNAALGVSGWPLLSFGVSRPQSARISPQTPRPPPAA